MFSQQNYQPGVGGVMPTNFSTIRPGIGGVEKEEDNVNTTREKVHLDIVNPDKFPTTYSSALITTSDLCKKINGLFKGCGDYWGSTLKPNPTNAQLELNIYLKDLGDSAGKIKLVQPVTNIDKRSSISNRLSALNNRQVGRTYELTQDGKDIFEEFLLRYNRNKINWKQHTQEVAENISMFQGSKYNIYLKLFNLDINAVLKKLWGSKGENGETYDYSIAYVRPITQTNHIIEVKNYDNKAIERIADQAGIIPTTGNFGIVR